MEAFLVDIIRWSQDNLMRINWKKTKEMLLGPIAKQQIPDLSVDDMPNQLSTRQPHRRSGLATLPSVGAGSLDPAPTESPHTSVD